MTGRAPPTESPELPPLEQDPDASQGPGPGDLGIVMGGGGARAAYQIGFLRCAARLFPNLRIPYVTGVSAGAINAALLASHHGTFIQAVDELTQLWGNLTVEDVFRTDTRSLIMNLWRWGIALIAGGNVDSKHARSLVDTQPLRCFLEDALHPVNGEITGIGYNLETGRLKAAAISTSRYATGRSITWVQGKDVDPWERPHRRSREAVLTVEHVMASTALPLFFPAVELEDGWHGDGSVRLTAPLSPALHVGARRIIAVSTRYQRSAAEADDPVVRDYPPPAQVGGTLMNSVFLDLLDQDAMEIERVNSLLVSLPAERRIGLRPVKLLILRPSVDLGKLAYQYEAQLPGAFRFLTRGLGTRDTQSSDLLSFILFQPNFLRALMEIGDRDATARADEIKAFLEADPLE